MRISLRDRDDRVGVAIERIKEPWRGATQFVKISPGANVTDQHWRAKLSGIDAINILAAMIQRQQGFRARLLRPTEHTSRKRRENESAPEDRIAHSSSYSWQPLTSAECNEPDILRSAS